MALGPDIASLQPGNPVLNEVVVSTAAKLNLIGRKIVPVIVVDPQQSSGVIRVESRRPFMGSHLSGTAGSYNDPFRRAPGGGYRLHQTGEPTTVSYAVIDRGGKHPVPREHQRRNRSAFPLIARETESVVRDAMMDEEIRLAALLNTTANWTGTATVAALAGGGGVQWNSDGSTPLADLTIACELFRQQSGGNVPDTLEFGWQAFEPMRRNQEVRGALLANPGAMSTDVRGEHPLSADGVKLAIASATGVRLDRIFVSPQRHETANPAAASSEADLWPDNVVIGKFLDGDAIAVPGGARVRPIAAATIVETPFQTDVVYEREANGDVIRWDHTSHDLALQADLVYVLTDAHT